VHNDHTYTGIVPKDLHPSEKSLAGNCQAAKRKEKGIGWHPTPLSWQNLGNFPIQPL
jgi:hypothetical protein